MPNFAEFFKCHPQEIKKNCIFVPCVNKTLLEGFKIKDYSNRDFYGIGQADRFTLLNCRMGAGFCGDAVLALAETACESLYLFGSCGAVKRNTQINLGSLVMPYESVSLDSFSSMLNNKLDFSQFFKPDHGLSEKLIQSASKSISKVRCATLASLMLETQFKDQLVEQNIDVVDMECSAFFQATEHIQRKAAGLFYVSDILDEISPFASCDDEQKAKIENGRKNGQRILEGLILNL